jgi:hypothetical protein
LEEGLDTEDVFLCMTFGGRVEHRGIFMPGFSRVTPRIYFYAWLLEI